MTTQFSELLNGFNDSFNQQFGEEIRVIPMTRNDYTVGKPDLTIPPFSLTAIVSDAADVIGAIGQRAKGRIDANVAGTNSVICVMAEDCQCAGREVPRSNWIIERQNGRRYRVAYAQHDERGRIHLHVEAA